MGKRSMDVVTKASPKKKAQKKGVPDISCMEAFTTGGTSSNTNRTENHIQIGLLKFADSGEAYGDPFEADPMYVLQFQCDMSPSPIYLFKSG